MPEQGFSPTLSKSGRVNKDLSVYSSATGWDECETGQTDPFHQWRGFFSFDTSSMDDNSVITAVTFSVRRRADPLGDPETYVLRFSIGTFIGAALDGNSQEWGAGTEVASLTSKPADKQTVPFSSTAHALVNPAGDTDVKLWDDSTQGGGDGSYGTNFNKNAGQLCALNIAWVVPQLGVATATGKGTASAAGTVSGGIEADATATGVGTAAATAVLEMPGVATATGVGAATGAGTVEGVLFGVATATGVGSVDATAVLEVPGAATVKGVGTATGTAVQELLDTATATGVGAATGTAVLEVPGTATVKGIGTATGAGTVEGVLFGVATATGVGAATGEAVLEVPGVGTATGVGTAAGDATLWLGGKATALGVGSAAGSATLWLSGLATATGVGTAEAAGIVLGNIAHWGEPLETYTGGPRHQPY